MDAGGRQSLPPTCLRSREVAVREGARTGSLGTQMRTLAPSLLPFPSHYSLLWPASGCPLEALAMRPHQMHMGLTGDRPPSADKIKHTGKILQNQNKHCAADVHCCIHCMSIFKTCYFR